MKATRIAALASVGTALAFAGCDKSPEVGRVEPVPPQKLAETTHSVSAPTPSVVTAPTPDVAVTVPERIRNESRPQNEAPKAEPPRSQPIAVGDFQAEAARVLSLPEGPGRDATLAEFVRGSMRDGGFESTREWMHKLPKGSARDTAYAAFSEDLAGVAPMLALDYVREIADPDKRAKLEATIRSSPRFTPPPTEAAGNQEIGK